MGLATLGVAIWGLVDAARRPESEWQASGENRALWIGLQAVALALLPPAALVVAIVYLATVRPKLRAVETSASKA